MKELKAGTGFDIPEEQPISPKGLKELGRFMRSQEKPETPCIDSNHNESGVRHAFKLLQYSEQEVLSQPPAQDTKAFPAPQVPPHLLQVSGQDCTPTSAQRLAFLGRGISINSTACSSSLDPSFFSSVVSEEAQARKEAQSTETVPNRDTLGIFPTTAHCNRCAKRRFTRTRVQLPTLSVWQLLCCVNDIVWCCTRASDWKKYQQIEHRCSICSYYIGTVEPSDL